MRRTPRRLATARRGAVLPLVAILIAVLVLFVGVAIDLGRMYATAAELQTAADAAALGAARAVQLDAATAATAARTGAQGLGTRNHALGAAVAIAAVDVVPRAYVAANDFAASDWTAGDAVQVTARASDHYLFAGVMGAVMPAVARQSTAWIASVNGAACIKPWALPYGALYALTGSAPDPAPALTRPQLSAIARLSSSAATLVFSPPGDQSSAPDDGEWEAADFTGAQSVGAFGDWVAGVQCSGAAADIARPTLTLQGASDASVVDQSTARAVDACGFRGAGSALCWASATAAVPGAAVRVVWADLEPTAATCTKRGNGKGNCKKQKDKKDKSGGGAPAAGPSTVRMIGQLVVMCYIRATSDVCPAQPGFPDGGWAPPGAMTGYPVGTIIGIVRGVASTTLGPDVRLGGTVGQLQRLVLVR